MEQYLIDTNVVSDYLTNSFSVSGFKFLDVIINKTPIISIITKIELLCWNTDIETNHNIKSFIDDSKVLNISDEIIYYCVKLRKSKKIKTPDALIAATALAYGYTLITNNEKDFLKIDGLKVINPYKL